MRGYTMRAFPRTGLLLTVACMLSIGTGARAATIYVDADSPNDGPGNDWAHGFHSVQAGLGAASPED